MFHVKHISQASSPGVIPCARVRTAFRACTCPPGAHYYFISGYIFCQEHFTENFLVDNFPTIERIENKSVVPAKTDKLLFAAPVFRGRSRAVGRHIQKVFGLMTVNRNLAHEHHRGELRKGIVADIPVAPLAEIVFDCHLLKVTSCCQIV